MEMKEEEENIIEVRGAFKRYSSKQVIFRGLNMTVPKGTIYGLLGPSGCGKTTLLSCVSGLLSLDSGSVCVRLNGRRQLGYMPQDIALMELFTVSEMFYYFGKVHSMSSSRITERGHELLELMELPPSSFWNRAINAMSGGQQRRISLCVALLHDPILLILDEPTVGLDPLINERLWTFFLDISEKQKKTLIITTHYIDEAKNAHTIGLMRNGVLLAEKSPTKLLKEYGCDALEDVFLLLSKKQSVTNIDNEESYPKNESVKPPIENGSIWNRKRMGAQIYKNLCWSKRNIPMLLFMLVLPAFLMCLFCTVYSDTLVGVGIATVSAEVLPGSCLNPVNHTTPPRCSGESQYSCRYISLLEHRSYTIREYADYDSAHEAVLKNKVNGLMYFSHNYSYALQRRLSEDFKTPKRYVNDSNVVVYLDMAEMTIAHKMKKDIIDSFYDLTRLIFSDCNWNPRAAQPSINMQPPVFGEINPKFIDTAIAGFIIPFIFYITTVFSASSLSSEKSSGFLERSLVSGVRYNEMMIAHAIMQLVMVVGQNIMLLTIAYGVFKMPMKGNWALVVLVLLMTEIQGMFYGFFLGTLCKEERNITYASIGTVMALFLTSGMFWPIEGAHWIISSLLRISPIVMAVESYRSITLRAWGLSNTYITNSFSANISFTVFLIFIFAIATMAKK